MPTANAGRSGFTRPVLTRRQLSIGWSARQSPFAQAAAAKTHQATIARSWGTTPGLNFVYAHLNRAIRARDLNVINTQSEMAAAYALPRSITAQGVRRYGFHGLSYEYIASVLPDVLGPVAAEDRVVIAPLAGGASMYAMRRRRSVATTMGFTALDGLPIGPRCGNLDPGVILYLMQENGMTAEAVSDLLYHSSGLKGVSGISDDTRTLLASDDPLAAWAIALFVYQIGRALGSFAASLGGLDALVFTAGIGEQAPEIRRRVGEQAAWLGVGLDDAANAEGAARITRPESLCLGHSNKRRLDDRSAYVAADRRR